MAGVLVVADGVAGAVRPVTAELVSAAAVLSGDGPVALVVIGGAPSAEIPSLAGVDEIVTVDPGTGETFDAAAWVAAIVALVREREPAIVLGAYSIDGMGWGAAVAARLGSGFASDVTAARLDAGSLVAERAPYGGKLVAEVAFAGHDRVLLLLRGGVWPAAPAGAVPPRTSFTAPASPLAGRVVHRRFLPAPASDVDIGAADVLVSIGRGIGDQGNVELFETVADKLGAVLSASRPLIDAGWLPHARQVGQSGTIVAPAVYLAFGISGAVQHLAGIRAARTIIAVNSDPQAPIFGVAHYGAVADAIEVAEALTEL